MELVMGMGGHACRKVIHAMRLPIPMERFGVGVPSQREVFGDWFRCFTQFEGYVCHFEREDKKLAVIQDD